MHKVMIIGNAGGGKSTLGLKLSERHGLPFHSVDQLQWQPGWMAAPEAEVRAALEEITGGESWIIDGWGPWSSIECRKAAADTIIFVDLPLWVHFWLAAERQIDVARGMERTDPIEGCDQLSVTKRLFETIWRVDAEFLPRLRQLLERHREGKDYRHVTTLEALDTLGAEAT